MQYNYDSINEGHIYRLTNRHADRTDASNAGKQLITFVKRKCETAAHDEQWDGAIMQDFIRVLIDRAEYLYSQQPCEETKIGITYLTDALYWFETRAWRRHKIKADGRAVDHNKIIHELPPFNALDILNYSVNQEGHIIT